MASRWSADIACAIFTCLALSIIFVAERSQPGKLVKSLVEAHIALGGASGKVVGLQKHITHSVPSSAFSMGCKPYPGKRVVMVSANSQYYSMLDNWFFHAAPHLNPDTDQVVLIAEDAQSQRDFQNMSAPYGVHFDIYHDGDWAESKSGRDAGTTYMNPVWASVVTHRPRLLLRYLEAGCTVLYVDVDAMWIKSLPLALAAAGHHDLLITDDRRDVTPGRSNYLCTCLLYLQPTPASRALVKRYGELAQGQQDDQFPFNKALSEHEGKIDYVVLPPAEFPNGVRFARNPKAKEAVWVHANWLRGFGAKIAFLKKHGMWHDGTAASP